MGIYANLTYDLFMFPFEKTVLHGFRKTTVANAAGNVLEIGVGTGVNSRYLDSGKVKSLTVLDTNIRDTAMKKISGRFDNFMYHEGSVENMPFADNSFDTVLFTLVFCSVPDPDAGLSEIRRVLKDNGKVIFIEHVKPENHSMQKAAERINPAWNSFSNGCNINRETLESIESAGFSIVPGTYKRSGIFITGTAVKK